MKRLLFIPLLLLALSVGAQSVLRTNSFYTAPASGAPPPLVVSDNFAVNYNPLWDDTDWGLGIGGNLTAYGGVVASGLNTEALAYYEGTFDADQYSEVIISGVPNNGFRIGCAVRVSTNNGYALVVDANDYILFEIVAGAYNQIVTAAGTFAINDEIELRITGTTLKMYKNDVQFGGDQTDNSLSSGNPGVAGTRWDSDTHITSFEGGEL